MQTRLADCDRTHSSCRSTDQTRWPKRVLALEESLNGEVSVTLMETQDSGVQMKDMDDYAALSHCWGSSQTCITTTSNLEARKAGIPWEALPKTFQDAIQIVLRLDIKYIWIDSLCILQDDTEDWHTESAKMADVYELASLTLAATASPADSHGCYSPSLALADGMELVLPEGVGPVRIAVRKHITHWDAVGHREMCNQFPLLSRGWAYQERLLSRRILHFCETELVWECRDLSVCECGSLALESSPAGKYYRDIEAGKVEWRLGAPTRERLLKLSQDRATATTRAVMIPNHVTSQDRGWRSVMHRLRSRIKAGKRQDDTPTPTLDVVEEAGLDSDEEAESDSYVELELPESGRNVRSRLGLGAFRRSVHAPPTLTEPVLPTDTKEAADYVFHFHRIVEEYSTLRLTRPSDRLPALSGLCEKICRFRGKYAAGLWQDSLPFDLMWRVEPHDLDSPIHSRHSAYSGPSWSWVSVDYPVRYWPDIINFISSGQPEAAEEQLELGVPRVEERKFPAYKCLGRNTGSIRVHCDAVGHNRFGNVKPATLKFRAARASAYLRYTHDSYHRDPGSKVDLLHYKLTIGHSMDNADIRFFADYPLAASGPDQLFDGYPLTLVLIHPRIALVVRPVDRQFKRVGIARLSDSLVNQYEFDWMLGSFVAGCTII